MLPRKNHCLSVFLPHSPKSILMRKVVLASQRRHSLYEIVYPCTLVDPRKQAHFKAEQDT